MIYHLGSLEIKLSYIKIALHIPIIKNLLKHFYLVSIKTHYSEHQLGKLLQKTQHTLFFKLQKLYYSILSFIYYIGKYSNLKINSKIFY